jgi:alpha-aminoadipic semialdehyde synthase
LLTCLIPSLTKGGLEFLAAATTLSSPFYDIDCSPLPSVRMMAVDILPASMPLDASNHFSSALEPYLVELIHELRTGEPGSRSAAIKRATIVDNGELTEDHKWLHSLAAPHVKNISEEEPIARGLRNYLQRAFADVPSQAAADLIQETAKKSKKSDQKQVLLLGSGMVAQPAVDYLVCKYGAKLMIGWLSCLFCSCSDLAHCRRFQRATIQMSWISLRNHILTEWKRCKSTFRTQEITKL